MVRMFCTVDEAAEKLDANPEQIESLLERGILHEFRDGPYRLVKTVEVGVLATARKNTVERGNPDQRAAAPLPPGCDRVATSGVASGIRLPRSATAAVRSPDGHSVRPRKTRKLPPKQRSGIGPSERGPIPDRARRPLPRGNAGWRGQRVAMAPSRKEPQDLSVRQWLWAGLTQDRPAAIALLAGFLLLALSALVAGICMLHEIV